MSLHYYATTNILSHKQNKNIPIQPVLQNNFPPNFILITELVSEALTQKSTLTD